MLETPALIIDKVELALCSYVEVHRGNRFPGRHSFYPSQRSGERQTPCSIFSATSGVSLGGAAGAQGIARVALTIQTLSHSQDSTAQDHVLANGQLIEVLNDKDALRAWINSGGPLRPVGGLHVYDYQLVDSGKKTDGAKWWSEITLNVVAQPVDF